MVEDIKEVIRNRKAKKNHDFHQMMFVSFNSNTAAVMWDRTANPSGAHEFTPSLSGVRVARYVFSV
jgi:hypothetical protein